MSSLRQIENFINGRFVAPQSAEYLTSDNPSRGEAHLRVPRSSSADVAAAVQAARDAFPAWSALRPEDRADWLTRIADRIDARADEFAEAESLDQGKPVKLARQMDIARASTNFRFFAGVVRQELSVAAPLDARTFSYVRREPIGVAGLISPWNLPLYLLTWKLAPALAYGNTAVAKPSELTSLTASLLAEVFRDVGLPPGVANLVFGLGAEAGQALVEHPDVPVISFTGGTVTGRKLAITAAPLLKKLSLELGGKNPSLVFDDANLDRDLSALVRSSFLNQGEICLCGSRLYVHAKIYESFVERFVREVESLKVGDPRDPETFMGPLVSREHLAKVKSYIAWAKDAGLQVRTGGEAPANLPENLRGGFFLRPTVITSPTRRMDQACKIQQEEVFGPVVTISAFETFDEVIAQANSTRYGLSASVWTESLSRAHEAAARLHAGTVWVNGWMLRDLRLPFGGVKDSGLGREGQLDSLHLFTEPKTVTIRYGDAT